MKKEIELLNFFRSGRSKNSMYLRPVVLPAVPASDVDKRAVVRSECLELQLSKRLLDPTVPDSSELARNDEQLTESENIVDVSVECRYNMSRFERMDMAFERGVSAIMAGAQIAAPPASSDTDSSPDSGDSAADSTAGGTSTPVE